MAETTSPEANSEAQAPKEKYCHVKQPREDKNHPSERSNSEGYGNATFIRQPLDKEHEELNELLKSLPHDDQGILHVGSDGVVRTLTADRDVLSAVALPPRLLKALLDIFPYSRETEDKFRGVDGTLVPREQWFHPDKSLLPPPLTAEKKEEGRKFREEHKEVLERRHKEMETEERKVVIISDYDIIVN
ncbi:hypothetical protein BDV11DRAFT_166640 [Aspergillus similis]